MTFTKRKFGLMKKAYELSVCVTARLPSLFSITQTSSSSMPAPTWTKCSSNTPSTTSRTKAGQRRHHRGNTDIQATMNPPNFRWQEIVLFVCWSHSSFICLLLLFIPSFLSLVNRVNLVAVVQSIALFGRD